MQSQPKWIELVTRPGRLQVALAALLNEAGFDSVDRMAMESLTEMASSILNEIGTRPNLSLTAKHQYQLGTLMQYLFLRYWEHVQPQTTLRFISHKHIRSKQGVCCYNQTSLHKESHSIRAKSLTEVNLSMNALLLNGVLSPRFQEDNTYISLFYFFD